MNTLIGYAVLAAGLLMLALGINHELDAHYTAPVRAELAQSNARNQGLATDLDTARRGNDALKASIAAATQKCESAAADVAAIQRRADAQLAATKDAIARAQAAKRASDAEVTRLRNAAKTATPGDKAAQCAAADLTLSDLAKERRP